MRGASFCSFVEINSMPFCRQSFDLAFNILSSEEFLREGSVIEGVLTQAHSRFSEALLTGLICYLFHFFCRQKRGKQNRTIEHDVRKRWKAG